MSRFCAAAFAAGVFALATSCAGLVRAQQNPPISPYDLVLRNARVVDGTGSPWYRADLGIRGDTIARIAPSITEPASRIIDLGGLVATPGFIDLHTHSGDTIFQVPTADNYIRQGVTTIMEGADGAGSTIGASTGIGTLAHVAGELFKMMAGSDLVHVPYRGGGPAQNDVLGGQAQVLFSTPSASIAYIRAGMLRPLAVTTATRSDTLPDIPTVGEFVPGYEATYWSGICAPKNTPAEIIDKLNREINAALADPKLMGRLAELGAMVFASSPTEFGKLIADETEKCGKVIRAANIKPE